MKKVEKALEKRHISASSTMVFPLYLFQYGRVQHLRTLSRHNCLSVYLYAFFLLVFLSEASSWVWCGLV